MVAVVQAHGDRLGWHPQVHAIATRGGWDTEGSFVPMPFVSTTAAERLFRHQVITLLRDEDLLTEERIELLLSWRLSGFSAHNAVIVPPGDRDGIERLARYLLRAPVSLERLRLRRAWAQMIRRIYEVDPLTCTECGSEMRILAFLLAPAVVRKILDHLAKRPDRARAPPVAAFVATAA